MKRVTIRGRRTQLPSTTTEEEIRRVGRIKPGRIIGKKTKEGHYVLPPGSEIRVRDGDSFFDAPRRVKG